MSEFVNIIWAHLQLLVIKYTIFQDQDSSNEFLTVDQMGKELEI